MPLQDGSVDQVDSSYDAAGNLVSYIHRNPKGSGDQVTLYQHDELNRLVTTTLAAGVFNYQTISVYDKGGNAILSRASKGSGLSVTNWNDPAQVITGAVTYDELNRPLTSQINAWSPLTNSGQLLTTNYSYNDAQNLHSVINPYGVVAMEQSDAEGRPISATVLPATGAGVQPGAQPKTSYSFYDARNLVIRTLDPAGNQHDATYDLLGRTTSSTSYTGPGTTGTALTNNIYYQDTLQPRVTTIGPAPNFVRQDTFMNEVGRVITTTNYTGPSVAYPTVPSGAISSFFGYDPQGNRTSVTNPDGHTTYYNYDNTGWLLNQQDRADYTALLHPNSGGLPPVVVRTVNYTHDSVGNVLSVSDPGRNFAAKTYQYDALNRVVSSSDPLNHQYNSSYDGLNRVVSDQDAKGQTSTYTYDNVSRRLQLVNASSITTTYQYNTAGLPITRNDTFVAPNAALISGLTSYTYDGLGQLNSVTNPQGLVNYVYDVLGRRTSLSFGPNSSNLKQVSYQYDALGRLTNLQNWQNQALTYSYSGEQLAVVNYPNNLAARFSYDGFDRLTAMAHTRGTPVVAADTIFRANYTLDNIGNTTATSEVSNGNLRNVNYTYSYELNWLTQELITTNGGSPLVNNYLYDMSGNRVQLSSTQSNGGVNITNYNYDAANRLVSDNYKFNYFRSTSVHTYNYDANNNLTDELYRLSGREVNPAPGAPVQIISTTYNYDARNRLVQWGKQDNTGNQQKALFTYDGANHRTTLNYNNSITAYLEDAAAGGVLQETLNGQPGNSFMYSPGSTTALYRSDSTNQGVWYHHDAGGSVRALSDPVSGNLLDSYSFDNFGVTTGQSGSVTNNRQFAGDQLDPTGLYYNGCNYYQPSDAQAIGGNSCGGSGAGANTGSPASGNGLGAPAANRLGRALNPNKGGRGGPGGTGSGLPNGGSNCQCIVECTYQIDLIKQPDPVQAERQQNGGNDPFDFLNGLMDQLVQIGQDLNGINNGLSDFINSLEHGQFNHDALNRAGQNATQLWNNPLVQAAVNMIPTLISTALDFIPGFGEVKMFAEAVFGHDLITGRELSGWDRVLSAIPLVGELGGALLEGVDSALSSANSLDGAANEATKLAEGDPEAAAQMAEKDSGGASEIGRTGTEGASPSEGFDAGAGDTGGDGATCSINSFSADTPIATDAQGDEKPISDVKVSDSVLAYDQQTNTTGVYTVTAIISNTDPVVTDLVIDGDHIETTPMHPFYTEERGWVVANNLWAGAHVRKANGTYGLLQSLKLIPRQQKMYNLTVAVAHTFFVGDQQWLVHNIKCSQQQLDDAVTAQQHVGISPVGKPTDAVCHKWRWFPRISQWF